MCGVYYTKKVNQLLNLDAIRHRGPEDLKLINLSHATVGFCRLPVRELNLGTQPLINRNFVSAINGELYNQREIEERILELSPEVSIPKGDMNILAFYLYLTNGEGLKHARGMFAGFIDFISFNKILFFRDIIGEKPLFFRISDCDFSISSENRFDEIEGFKDSPYTISNIELLRGLTNNQKNVTYECSPGKYYWYNYITGNLESESYFAWPKRPAIIGMPNFSKLESKLIVAIEEQLVSDVPVSIMLSGGIDSSLIASIAKKILNAELYSHTLKFENESWNESKDAEKLAIGLGLNHNTHSISNEELATLIPEVISAMDVPIFDTGCISFYALSKEIAKSFKVALSGDGGDELSRGYEIYKWNKYLEVSKLFSPFVLPILYSLSKQFDSSQYNSLRMKLDRAISVCENRKISTIEVALSPFAGTPLLNFLIDKYQNRSNVSPERYYTEAVLPLIYLVKTDRMSMANSLEIRSPFLSKPVLEEAFKISNLYLSIHKRKFILRKIAKKYISSEILNRPKHGFSAPFSEIMSFLNRPKWHDDLYRKFGSNIDDTWVRAKDSQNHATASWALLVLNEFLMNKKIILD